MNMGTPVVSCRVVPPVVKESVVVVAVEVVGSVVVSAAG